MFPAHTPGVLDFDSLKKPIFAITLSISSITLVFILLWLGRQSKKWVKAIGVSMQVAGISISSKFVVP